MKNKSNHLVSMMLTAIILLGFLNPLPIAIGKEIIEFDNGGGDKTEWEVELVGDLGYCSDSTTHFSVPIHKGKIQEASLKVTCEPNDQGETLMNPRLDIGIDGDYEWEFSGRGYGAVNHQTIFTTGMERRVVAIGQGLVNNRTSVLLPKSASILDAKMEIEGGDLNFGDIYVALITSNANVYYMKYNGNRQFATPQHVADIGGVGWPQSNGIGIGDFDNDGDNDIVANEGSWSASTTLGNIYLLEKTGTSNSFASKVKVGTTGYYINTDFAVGDFNKDKHLDFIVSERNQNIYYFKGFGDLTFNKTQVVSSFGGGTAYGKDAADFNLDGNMDFVVGGSSIGSVYVFPGNGDGTFKPDISISSGTSRDAKCVIAGDFNVDGNPDIIAKDTNWWPSTNFQFVPGKGDFTFSDPIDMGNSLMDWNMAGDGFDFDFDGYQDFVVHIGSTIYCFWGDKDNSFQQSTQISGPASFAGIATPPSEVLGGCDNLIIDVGEDDSNTPNFQPVTGPFNTKKEINFKSQIESLLATPSAKMKTITDDYGNELYEIPIKFTASAIGNVLLKNLSIRYSYTAKVDKNPHNLNLVNELNDLIPKTGTGNFKVYLKIASDSPGKVTFSDLNIKFNEAPILTKNIPNLLMAEGTEEKKLENLALYYDDDDDAPEDMTYTIYSYTNQDHLFVDIYENIYLHVNANIEPDWHGETSIIVEAEDSESGITRSNKFKVIINPVNDPPRLGRVIPNIELKTNEVNNKIDLDDPMDRYFYDVDSTGLYFRAVTVSDVPGEFDEFLKISINNDTNILKFQSFDQYKKGIQVRIYCSDSESVRTMKLSELGQVPTYQDILVNITKFGMGKKPTFPPNWEDLEDIEIPEDESRLNLLNLNNYTTDPDDEPEDITYSIESLTNSAFIDVYITTSKDRKFNLLSIAPEENFAGESIVVIRAEDDEHNYALEEFKVIMVPEPDIPLVEILAPMNGSLVSGVVSISGRAFDAEGELKLVEVKIGNDQWQTAIGLAYWSYPWETNDHSDINGVITIKARAMDIENRFSELDMIQVSIDNATLDSDDDGIPNVHDAFPDDPLDWLDTDGDGIGDNTDMFPTEPTQWFDADGDGYGDNPSGVSPDAFSLDPTQWSDSDNDGYGDNLNGNNPDYYPDNSKKHAKDDGDNQGFILSTKNLMWFAILPFIIIDIIIFILYSKKRKKSKETEINK
ncbi:FG-GAP-like repeat-containing protein [[Eubacterium] cellulosolvens]